MSGALDKLKIKFIFIIPHCCSRQKSFTNCCCILEVYNKSALIMKQSDQWVQHTGFVQVKIHLFLKRKLHAEDHIFTLSRRQSKMLILSMNADQKLLETVFVIAICYLTGDKWQSKTLFLLIFYPHSSIFKSIFDCRLQGVALSPHQLMEKKHQNWTPSKKTSWIHTCAKVYQAYFLMIYTICPVT